MITEIISLLVATPITTTDAVTTTTTTTTTTTAKPTTHANHHLHLCVDNYDYCHKHPHIACSALRSDCHRTCGLCCKLAFSYFGENKRLEIINGTRN
jgi:hypothetical protein